MPDNAPVDDRRAVAQRHQRHRPAAAFAEVARLRDAGHDGGHPSADPVERRVDMTEAPQVEPVGHQVPLRAGRIGVVPLRPVEGGVHHPHVQPARHRCRVIGQEAFRHMGGVEGQAVEHRPADLDRGRALVQQVDARPEIALRGVVEQRIVVAADQHRRHAGLGRAGQLRDQEGPRFQVRVVVVEDVARQHQRIDPLRDGEVDDPHEGVAARPLQAIAEVGVAQGDGLDGRPQVQVGGHKQAHRHPVTGLAPTLPPRRAPYNPSLSRMP